VARWSNSNALRWLPALLVSFAVGVGVLQTRDALPSPGWSPALAALLLVAGCLHVRRAIARGWTAVLVVAAALAGGFGYAAWRAELRLADALPPQWEGQDIAIVGVVDDLPRGGDRLRRFAFRVERVATAGAHVPERVSLSWHAGAPADAAVELPQIRAGERWLLTVRLRRPHGTANRGGFDLEAWLLERNLRATGQVRADEANRRLDALAGRPLDYVQRARETIRERAMRALANAPHAAVLVALAIGDQSGIDERAWTVFNRTGVGHLISISGLHVTVFAMLAGGLAYALVRPCVTLTSRVPARKVAALAGLVAAAGYVLLAGAEVPAQRTLAMLAVSALGIALGRPGTGLLIWLWALVIVLVADPWAVLAPGFWLSFFAVGLLIFVSAGRVPRAFETRMRDRVGRELRDAARSQAAITIGLVPLSLLLFQQVSLIGPLANAVAIPVVTFAIVPLTLTAALLPFDAPWRWAHALLEPLMAGLTMLASLPGAAWAQHQPPTWAVAIGFTGVAWCLAPRGVPGRVLGLIALAPLVLVRPTPPSLGTFRLTALDVGQGTAIVVQTHRHALLYDTGPRWNESADAGNRIVAPWLRANGIRTLDALVVSHADSDHSGGALSVLQLVPTVLLRSSLPDDNPIVLRQLEQGTHLRCRDGQRWEWDGVAFEFVFPRETHYADRWRKSNDLSCVLRVASPGGSALLAGDIEAVSELDLLIERRDALAAHLLLVPHHGSRTSSTQSFVEAVAPRHAVFSVGHRNRFGHPREDVVARYRDVGATLYRTDRSGALTFSFTPPGPGPPQAERVRVARYWHALPDAR
jgi:competence protein ComEC